MYGLKKKFYIHICWDVAMNAWAMFFLFAKVYSYMLECRLWRGNVLLNRARTVGVDAF